MFRDLPTLYQIKIPNIIIPNFADWAMRDLRQRWRPPNFPNLEARTRLEDSVNVLTNDESPCLPWELVQIVRSKQVEVLWNSQKHQQVCIGIAPLDDVQTIATRAMETYQSRFRGLGFR